MNSALIVDDHPLMRMAVRIILEDHHIEVLGEAEDGITALSLARKLNPALMVLDIGIPKLDGLEVISRLRHQGATLNILVISSQQQDHFAGRCVMAGAQGFVSKKEALNELAEAVKTLRAGRVYLPVGCYGAGFPALSTQKTHCESYGLGKLSNREMVVLQYLARGWGNKAIADELLLSNKTISTYKTRLLDKLNAHNLVDLIELAKRHLLV
ncbi:MAG TPA: DNA-binding response regulator [Serratia grimesii]|uniref:DNA-binding response regulator n=1 Tax=Serratia grimesii TaxID=82995 RepID=A0A9C7QU06_9GAMM|nr:response regulator transcription factor [Serratia grimesii]HCK00056.1 DNA-binding response regulator [Serratia grimesii]